jgi:pimeloyl-ACP methyl ester carboxylesterase
MSVSPESLQESLKPPEPVQQQWITSADGIQLNVELHGPQYPATPTVVLLHGWTCSILSWAPVIRALRDEIRVVAYDQRGHGASDTPGCDGCSIEALASDLAAVLDWALRPGQKAVLAGHSMGGMVVMAVALQDRVLSRTSGALLASTGASNLFAEGFYLPFTGSIPPLVALQNWLLRSAVPLGPGLVSHLSRMLLSYLTLGPDAPAEVGAVNAAIIQACDRRARGSWGRILASPDVTVGASALDVPTHVLVGTADRLTPPAQASRIAQLLPRCEGVTELPGIGHVTPLEAPDVVAELIRKLAAASATASATASEPG